MPGLIVSSHGGRWSNQQRTLVVPQGSRVVFYVFDGQILSDHDGWELLEQLQSNEIDADAIAQVVNAGQRTYDYSCWYAEEFADGCGLYQVGSNQRLASLANYGADNPLRLSQILQRYPNRTIYWLACREVSDPDEFALLVQSKGAFPSRPTFDVTAPVSEIPGASILGYGFNALGEFEISSITQQIFQHQSSGTSQYTYAPTSICYSVPYNVTIIPDTGTTGSVQLFHSRSQFQNHYALEAGISGSYGVFSAHFEASYAQSLSSDQSYTYGLYESDITGWRLALADQTPNQLSTSFTNDPDVQALPTTYTLDNQQSFFEVFRKFGTHYVSQVQVGGSMSYYVAVERSFSASDTQIEANISLEYKALFVSTSVESHAEWQQLTQNWTERRNAKITAIGGDNSLLSALNPDYDDSFSGLYSGWANQVMKNPAVISFKLEPLYLLFSGSKMNAVRQAHRDYLNGAIVVAANADFTPGQGPGGGDFTTSSSIIVQGQPVLPTPQLPPPAPHTTKYGGKTVVWPVGGYHVVLLDGHTLQTILSSVYYQDYSSQSAETQIYDQILQDIALVNQQGYIAIVAGFAIDLHNYPTPAFAQWLTACGASMSGWKQYIGFTATPGQASYVLVGRRGLLPGNALESFAVATDWFDHPMLSAVDAAVTALLYAPVTPYSHNGSTYGSLNLT